MPIKIRGGSAEKYSSNRVLETKIFSSSSRQPRVYRHISDPFVGCNPVLDPIAVDDEIGMSALSVLLPPDIPLVFRADVDAKIDLFVGHALPAVRNVLLREFGDQVLVRHFLVSVLFSRGDNHVCFCATNRGKHHGYNYIN